jgi:tetratricopeptide (TPR) repeat protein
METPPKRRWVNRVFSSSRTKLFVRPIYVVWLSLGAAALFTLTFTVNRLYAQHQQQLSVYWFQHGEAALAAGKAQEAITDLRTALLYSHENQQYLLALAQALEAGNRVDEARSYLLSLLDYEPGSGQVNLELARLSQKTDDVRHAMRFYNGAIYGAWDGDPTAKRQQVRKELIDFLTAKGLKTQARGELLTLSAEMPKDLSSQLWVARAFTRLGDDRSALDFYVASLRQNRKDLDALNGAGQAAFRLARYRDALAYFRRAVALHPDAASTEALALTSLILQLNPMESALSDAERRHRLVLSMDIADRRLQQCAQTQHIVIDAPGTNPLQLARSQWLQLDRQVAHARGDSDLVQLLQPIASLILRIEQQGNCGPPAQTDEAMLHIYSNAEELQP